MILVWGLARGETQRYTEELLASTCRTAADVEKVKAAASLDGWHSFRTSEFVEGEMPDFGACVRRR